MKNPQKSQIFHRRPNVYQQLEPIKMAPQEKWLVEKLLQEEVLKWKRLLATLRPHKKPLKEECPQNRLQDPPKLPEFIELVNSKK